MRRLDHWIVLLAASALLSLPALADDWDKCANVADEETAIAACSKLIDRGKESRGNRSIIYANRGAAYLNLRDYDSALTDLNEALHLDAQSAHALYNRGATYYFKGAHEDAIRDLTRSIKLDSSDAKAYFYRGRAERELDRLDDAVKDFSAAIAIDPSGGDFYDYRGRAFHALDDYNSALADYDKAVAMGQGSADILNNRADVLLKLGRFNEALAGADTALKKDPAHALSMVTRGEALEKVGRRDEAATMFRRALGRNSELAEAKEGLARVESGASPGGGGTSESAGSEPPSAPAGDAPEPAETAMVQDDRPALDPAAAREQLKAVQGAYTTVGMSLLIGYAAKDPNKNIVLSPFSIGAALAMTQHGASGETEAEMRRVLHHAGARQDLVEANTLLLALFREERPEADSPLPTWARNLDTPLAHGPAVEIKVANGLATGPKVQLATAYVADLLTGFGAEPLKDATLQSINAWVSEKTDGRIPTILDNLGPNFTAVILNAVSLKARWKEPFDPTNTIDREFTTGAGERKKTPMMQNVGEYVVASADGVQAISIPYGDPAVEMIVLLPDDAKMLAPENLLETFSGPIASLWGALGQAGLQNVHLTLPKFEIEFKEDIAEAFQQMGMKRAFNSQTAEFANMTGPSAATVFIDQILHRGVIEVAELGTEAAAATAVVMAPGEGARPAEPPLEFRVDRPFIFVIGDKKSGATLFAGVVRDPSAR